MADKTRTLFIRYVRNNDYIRLRSGINIRYNFVWGKQENWVYYRKCIWWWRQFYNTRFLVIFFQCMGNMLHCVSLYDFHNIFLKKIFQNWIYFFVIVWKGFQVWCMCSMHAFIIMVQSSSSCASLIHIFFKTKARQGKNHGVLKKTLLLYSSEVKLIKK